MTPISSNAPLICSTAETSHERNDDMSSTTTKATGKAAATLGHSGGMAEVEGGRIGGYLVRWGSPHAVDSTGDFFTPDTDFWREFPSTIAALYHHGKDPHLGLRKLGKAELWKDDTGLGIELKFTPTDDYEDGIFWLAKEGHLGWSSGSAPHQLKRTRQPNGAMVLESWCLTEASLTPCPAEPRASATYSVDAIKGGNYGIFADPGTWLAAQLELRKRWVESSKKVGAQFSDILRRAQTALDNLDRRDRHAAALKAIDRRRDAWEYERDVIRPARRTLKESEAEARRARVESTADLRRTLASARRTIARTAIDPQP